MQIRFANLWERQIEDESWAVQELDPRMAPPSQARSTAGDPMILIFWAVLVVEHEIPSSEQ